MSCGVGHRLSSDLMCLWQQLYVAPIRSLPWELPYAAGAALKSYMCMCVCVCVCVCVCISSKAVKKMRTCLEWVSPEECSIRLCPGLTLAISVLFGSSGALASLPSTSHITPRAFRPHKGLTQTHLMLIPTLFFLFWLPHSIWSSQARDQIQATAVTYARDAATPDLLTHCVRLRIKPASWHCRDAADPVVLQQETPTLISFWPVVHNCLVPRCLPTEGPKQFKPGMDLSFSPQVPSILKFPNVFRELWASNYTCVWTLQETRHYQTRKLKLREVK